VATGPGVIGHRVSTAPTCGMPSGRPRGLQQMDVNTLFSMPRADRLDWYRNMLGPYRQQVRTSAACHGIPTQLLATAILNELADINWTDVWQQRLGMSGSLGIAQIQVDTALQHGLLDFPGDDARIRREQLRCAADSRHGVCLRSRDSIRRSLVYRRLTIPEFAIEAAARRIAQLIELMRQNLTRPWQQRFSFRLAPGTQLASPNDIYSYIAGGSRREQELNLSEMVVAAYNSPDIVIARNRASITPGASGFIYRNGTIHGQNSRSIAGDLFDANLFH
jgi:hypothetical protein